MTELRKPTVTDAESIASLSGELGYVVDADVMAQRIADLIDRDDHHLVVAEVNGQIAGWMQVHASEYLAMGLRTEITGLVVGAKFRRRGIGNALVDQAIKWSMALAANAITVRSNVARRESHEFYPAVGFELIKTQAVYRKSLTR